MTTKKTLLDLESAAHVMGIRPSTLLELTKPVIGCPVGEAALKYTRSHGQYFFTPSDLAEWLHQRLRSVEASRKAMAA